MLDVVSWLALIRAHPTEICFVRIKASLEFKSIDIEHVEYFWRKVKNIEPADTLCILNISDDLLLNIVNCTSSVTRHIGWLD